MRLAKWGYSELLVFTLAAAGLAALFLLFYPPAAVLPLALLAFAIWFFRDPHRVPPSDPLALTSPADGVVLDIEEVEEPFYLVGQALRIGIFMSPLNVHVNRAPTGGTVEFRHYRPGKFLAAYHKDAIGENESLSLGLRTDDGLRLLVKQITGLLARRIVCDARIGDRLERGERYGMIRFGSRAELYVPVQAKVDVQVSVGDKVRAGETILARLRS